MSFKRFATVVAISVGATVLMGSSPSAYAAGAKPALHPSVTQCAAVDNATLVGQLCVSYFPDAGSVSGQAQIERGFSVLQNVDTHVRLSVNDVLSSATTGQSYRAGDQRNDIWSTGVKASSGVVRSVTASVVDDSTGAVLAGPVTVVSPF